jgi:hypothetical protein
LLVLVARQKDMKFQDIEREALGLNEQERGLQSRRNTRRITSASPET